MIIINGYRIIVNGVPCGYRALTIPHITSIILLNHVSELLANQERCFVSDVLAFDFDYVCIN